MSIHRLVALSACLAYGLWWILFPSTVVRYYTWFHGLYGAHAKLPRTTTIRIAGALWIALMFAILTSTTFN